MAGIAGGYDPVQEEAEAYMRGETDAIARVLKLTSAQKEALELEARDRNVTVRHIIEEAAMRSVRPQNRVDQGEPVGTFA